MSPLKSEKVNEQSNISFFMKFRTKNSWASDQNIEQDNVKNNSNQKNQASV